MSETKPQTGQINWIDLTVPNAPEVMQFYRNVVGWTTSGLDMGGYEDWCVNLPGDGKSVAGICHARGGNAGLPSVWLIYINVANLDESMKRCVELGGSIKMRPRQAGPSGRYCVIQDPAGAYAALFEPATSGGAIT
jgi:uncharacterized protein